MIYIELTLPQGLSLDEMVEEWDMYPTRMRELADGRAVLRYQGIGQSDNTNCLKAAAKKVWGNDVVVTTDNFAQIYHEDYYCTDADVDVLKAFERSCYVYDPKNARRKMTSFAEKWGLDLKGGFFSLAASEGDLNSSDELTTGALTPSDDPNVCDDPDTGDNQKVRNSSSSYYISIGGGQNPHFSDGELVHQQTSPSGDTVELSEGRLAQHWDWENMHAYCQLGREFEQGIPFGHKVTWGIMGNYIQAEGGQTRFLEAMALRPDWSDEKKRGCSYDIRNHREFGYRPSSCEKYCPYVAQCNRLGRNMLDQVTRPGGLPRVIFQEDPAKMMDIREAEKLAAFAIKDAISDTSAGSENDIHLFIIPTGIGKTESILNVQNALVAVPTHDLAIEVQARMAAVGNQAARVGAVPAYSPDFDAKLDVLHKIGAHSKASAMITSEIKKIKHKKNRTEQEKALTEFGNSLSWLYDSDMTTIVTHQRALHLRHESVREVTIFDEDPMVTAIGITEASMIDLLILKSKAENDKELSAKVKDTIVSRVCELEKVLSSSYYNLPNVACSTSELADFVARVPGLTTNVLGLFAAAAYTKIRKGTQDYIVYARIPELPKGKVLILSATANEDVYKMAFPHRRVITHKIGPVTPAGRLRQCINPSLSKQQVERLGKDGLSKVFAQILDEIGYDAHVITRLDLQAAAEEAGMKVHDVMHYGKVCGFDDLKGKKVTVLGSYLLSEVSYLITAHTLDIRFGVGDADMNYKRIQHNNMEFYFPVFQHADLRTVQLRCASAEVTVFCSLPIPGAEFFELRKQRLAA